MGFRAMAAGVCLSVLAACGGGGGGDAPATPATRQPLARLSEDTVPQGLRLDYRSRNYFPLATSDSWTYQYVQNGVVSPQPYTRVVGYGPGTGSELSVNDTFNGVGDSFYWRKTADGMVLVAPFAGTVPAAASPTIGDVLEYAEPFFPAGGARVMLRQGDWGADVDGDGIRESFRFEFRQTFVGFESLTIAGKTLTEVARFRTVVTFTLQPSDSRQPVVTATGTEETWWAAGIGMVRADRSYSDSSGAPVDPPYTLLLTGGSVGGTQLFGPEPDGVVHKITLVHNALVFDRSRNRYLASVPGGVVGNGNRIAYIDATTRAVTYSPVVGSEPGALALSATGDALFVGLNGSGEVVKFQLPQMTEQWRVRLTTDSLSGQMFAESITVSPLDGDTVAVSMFRRNLSPRHGGVALVRGGVGQPRITQNHTGSNLVAFGADGQSVFGFNNETTEFGLRRIQVLADGLQEVQVVPALGNFATRTLDWLNGSLLLDRFVYRATDLALQGQINVPGGGCRPHAVPNRLLCSQIAAGQQTDKALAVVDASTLVVLSTPYFQRAFDQNWLTEIVPGAPGQAALRITTTPQTNAAEQVWLFDSQALQ